MNRMKTIGILGGMGPAATVDLFDRIVTSTPARRDQDHIPIFIVNNPTVPDRSEAILHDGPSPVPAMRAGLGQLQGVGVDVIVVPCNTAHHYLEELRAGVDVPILDMIQETGDSVRRAHAGVERVGVLATSGTLAVGLYQRALEQAGLAAITPTEQEIARIMDALYGEQGVKTRGVNDAARQILQEQGQALIERGAQALILGCTEIPLALHDGDLAVPLVASNQALAEAAVREATAPPE